MAEEDLIKTLDLCDSYVTSNGELASALKHCFFSLAQIRYSAGYGKAVLSDTSSTPALIEVRLLEESEPSFTLQHSIRGRLAKSPQNSAISSHEKPAQLDPPPAESSSEPESSAAPGMKEAAGMGGTGSLPGREHGPQGEFSSLISELAEKYGCGGQEDGGGSGEEDEAVARAERTFMPPQLRAAQSRFKEALQLAVQVINCRARLLRQLQETQR